MSNFIYEYDKILGDIKEDIMVEWVVSHDFEKGYLKADNLVIKGSSEYLSSIEKMLYQQDGKNGVCEYIIWKIRLKCDVLSEEYADVVALATHLGIDVPALVKEFSEK